MAHEILIVDDEADIRTQTAGILEDIGYKTRLAANSTEALAEVAGRQPALVILDVWLGNSELDGIETLGVIRRDHPDQHVLMISGHATFDMAVQATKMGAYDFLTKPFKADVLVHAVERAIRDRRLRLENQELRRQAASAPADIIGTSQIMTHLRQSIDKIGATDSRVLISGPSGSGKSLMARALHEASSRAGGPLIALNCASLRQDGCDAILFGREASGGRPREIGVIEKAHGGTLVLDEVADLPPPAQSRIVGFLHENTFHRVGSSRPIGADVRILTTTRRDLKAEVLTGSFHEELYYRLNVVPLETPPLSARRNDIAALARHMMNRLAADKGRAPRPIGPDGIAALEAYDWPGNFWELANVIERLLLDTLLLPDQVIDGRRVAQAIGKGDRGGVGAEPGASVKNRPLREAREAFEREYLLFHLARFGGNISRTAAFVEMDRAALHRKLKLLGVKISAKSEGIGA